MGGLEPYGDKAGLEAIAKAGVTAFAMELMPRITRAQAMDILSSQANLAGYKAVIDAAAHFTRAFPMMMTAAGTVPPAKVFIMGVGVAGLQAIATARRLGAIVSATDVRKATEEQVKSLGAKFVFADVADAATSGGYAKELSAEDKAKQADLIAFAGLGHEHKVKSIVTGVEDPRALTVLWTAGVDFVQGNFLQTPSPTIERKG